jgi:hypothetical protein
MAELVTIPISYFELAVDFERPDLKKLWVDRGSVVQGIFDALGPWNPSVDDIESLTTGKPSEQGVNFRLPLKRVSFFFGPASCKFTRDNASWESAEDTITILDAVLSALVHLGGVALGTKKTVIAIHLQPRTMTFMEILKPFVAPQLASLEMEALQAMAVVAKWEKRRVTLDGSAALANGLYLKLEREFKSTTTYGEIANQLRKDEEELFKLLGVEEDRG